MGKLTTYTFVSLNGYFKGANEDISWAKGSSKEEDEFAGNNLKAGNILLFGRVTYDLMASYWPGPGALKNTPLLAEGMNNAEKIVLSKTLYKAEWNNTRVVNGNLREEIMKLKQLDKDITLLGSGSILIQLADEGLIDEIQVMVYPVVITEGTSIFKGLNHNLAFKLVSTRNFESGAVLLCYESIKN